MSEYDKSVFELLNHKIFLLRFTVRNYFTSLVRNYFWGESNGPDSHFFAINLTRSQLLKNNNFHFFSNKNIPYPTFSGPNPGYQPQTS